MAIVYLEGNEFQNSDGSKPGFWKVVGVDYVKNYDAARVFLAPEWIKINIFPKKQVLV